MTSSREEKRMVVVELRSGRIPLNKAGMNLESLETELSYGSPKIEETYF